ncbi:MAG: glycosyltransferase [Candidatus Taylorbacteria bacterium]
MTSYRDMFTLGVLFISLYFEIFMLMTYCEHRKKIRGISGVRSHTDEELPSVTIVVPCFNEENTVGKTLDSLLGLDYPKSKLTIVAVNDGSTDGTSLMLESYRKYSQISILNKENGGKHTALNLAIARSTTEFVGCLDADSYVRPDALTRLMMKFSKQEVMAVVPSLQVYRPRSIVQRIQKVEYIIGAFMRTILAELNAMYVTPGPFSIFRKSVFEQIGYYKNAHNTEDMEMAMRMQSHGMKITSAHDAVVFTSSPETIAKLYKQRVRWTSGFLNNARDYKFMLFNIKYGNVGMFVLPFMIISAFSVAFVVTVVAYDFVNMMISWYVRYQAIGANMLEWTWPSFDWYFMRTTPLVFCSIVAIAIILSVIVMGSRMTSGNRAKILEVVTYVCLYSFIAPWWVMRSIYNVSFQKQPSWR